MPVRTRDTLVRVEWEDYADSRPEYIKSPQARGPDYKKKTIFKFSIQLLPDGTAQVDFSRTTAVTAKPGIPAPHAYSSGIMRKEDLREMYRVLGEILSKSS